MGSQVLLVSGLAMCNQLQGQQLAEVGTEGRRPLRAGFRGDKCRMGPSLSEGSGLFCGVVVCLLEVS